MILINDDQFKILADYLVREIENVTKQKATQQMKDLLFNSIKTPMNAVRESMLNESVEYRMAFVRDTILPLLLPEIGDTFIGALWKEDKGNLLFSCNMEKTLILSVLRFLLDKIQQENG